MVLEDASAAESPRSPGASAASEEPKARPPHSAAAFDPVDTKQKLWPILAQAVPYGVASYLASMCVTIVIFYRVYDGETEAGEASFFTSWTSTLQAHRVSCILCACKARPKWAACVTYQD